MLTATVIIAFYHIQYFPQWQSPGFAFHHPSLATILYQMLKSANSNDLETFLVVYIFSCQPFNIQRDMRIKHKEPALTCLALKFLNYKTYNQNIITVHADHPQNVNIQGKLIRKSFLNCIKRRTRKSVLMFFPKADLK